MTIDNMNDESKLLVKLQKRTRRDLVGHPPADTETMQKLGVSGANLDTFIRKWINREVRKLQGLRVLVKGEIKITTKWVDLKKMLTGAYP